MPRRADQPGPEDVHVDTMLDNPIRTGLAYAKRMLHHLKKHVTPGEFDEYHKEARAHAGGVAKASRQHALGPEVTVNLADLAAMWPDKQNEQTFAFFMEAPTFTEPPEWVNILPKPATYKHPSYGDVEITVERNQRFVQNVNDKVYQAYLPVDTEHNLKASGAVAHIVGARLNEDGSADAKMEWNPRGEALIRGDRFRYTSAEWWDEWTNPETGTTHKDVLIGMALTTRPFFKDGSLRSLVHNESGLHVEEGADRGDDGITINFRAFEPVVAGDKPQPTEEKVEHDTKPTGMTEDQAKEFAELRTKFEAAEADRVKAAAELTKAQETITALSETVKSQSIEARKKRFTDMVTGKGGEGDGLAWFGEVGTHVDILEYIASTDPEGETGERFKKYVEKERGTARALKESALVREVGRPGGAQAVPAIEAIETAARKLMSEDPKMTIQQARVRVVEVNPQLAREFEAQSGQGR